MEDQWWKKTTKGPTATTNFLEVLVDDEEVTFYELNRICGDDQHVFSRVRIPKNRLLVTFN
jgi:hypothetical protein